MVRGDVKKRLRQLICWVLGLHILMWVLGLVLFLSIADPKPKDRVPLLSAVPQSPLPWTELQHPLNLALGRDEQVLRLTLQQSPLGPIYRLLLQNGHERIFSALSGEAFSPIGPVLILKLARRAYSGTWPGGELNFLVGNPPSDYKGSLPIYQLVLNDFPRTTLYIDPYEGLVVARTNLFWRIYDSAWPFQLVELSSGEEPMALVLKLLSFLAALLLFFLWHRLGQEPISHESVR